VVAQLLPAILLFLATPLPAQVTLYTHARIVTGERLTTAAPQRAEALAVENGSIAATGTDEALRARYPHATIVDLHGATVLPGLNDAHVHLGEAARIRLSLDLTGVPSLAAMQSALRTYAQHTQTSWVTGGNWDHTLWPGRTLPTRADLDQVSGGHPVFLTRIDGHIGIANTRALALAGITEATADPQGGHFDRDPRTGELTGIVRETPAMRLIQQHIPPPTPAERRQGLELALADAAAHGLTSVQDNSEWDDFLILEALEREGKLPVRVTEWLPFDAPLAQLEAMRAHHPASDRMLHTGMLKGFMDGSLGSRTAALLSPYADDPGNRGLPRYDQAKLNTMSAERAAAGFQLGFHAIGDRAVDMALTAFAAAEQARTAAGIPGQGRFRIEHSQVLSPGDFARYKALGVIASMQPNHLLTDMHWAGARLGPARSQYAYAWKGFLDAGVPLAFGTDFPVEPITPFRGLYSAVTRADEAGTMTWFPQGKLSMGEALFAYTQGSAYAEFAETWKGKLLPGYAADFTVVDRDPFAVSAHDVLATKILSIVVGGRAVQAFATEATAAR
jgi:predicted amidohydrolase YtcJ